MGILVVVVYLALGGDPSALVGSGETAPPPADQAAGDEDLVSFVSFVLDDAQGVWETKLRDRYAPADLVLFSGNTPTACGFGQAAMGPFYCPRDRKVYIDLSFYRELRQRFGAPGDFAQAYVIAHEVAHHVQHQLGLLRSGDGATGANGLGVRTELQADCLAGIWARSTSERELLEEGDVEEALTAAQSIGDDTLQRQSGGVVSPETFTHGTSQQRARWFARGYRSGELSDCDTFGAETL